MRREHTTEKRIISVFIIGAMSIAGIIFPAGAKSVWDGETADISWYDSELSEFEISTAEQFRGIGVINETYQEDFSKKTIVLLEDLDLSGDIENGGGSVWQPIGENTPFRGTLDGGGHTISNIYVNGSGGGLFSKMCGTVENIGIDGFLFEGDGSRDQTAGALSRFIGDMANIRNSAIKNVRFVYNGNKDIYFTAGGLAGTAESADIEDTYIVDINIEGADDGNVGGFIGSVENGSAGIVMKNCYVAGLWGVWAVQLSNGAGDKTRTTVENCFATDFEDPDDFPSYANGIYLSSREELKEKLSELGSAYIEDTKNKNSGLPSLVWEYYPETLIPSDGKPRAPKIYMLSSTSVLVYEQTGMEYSVDLENWYPDGYIPDLTPGESYSVYARYIDNGEGEPSAPSIGTKVTLPSKGGNEEKKTIAGDGVLVSYDDGFNETKSVDTLLDTVSNFNLPRMEWLGQNNNAEIVYDSETDSMVAMQKINKNNVFMNQLIPAEELYKAGNGVYRLYGRVKILPSPNAKPMDEYVSRANTARFFITAFYKGKNSVGTQVSFTNTWLNWVGAELKEYNTWYEYSMYVNFDIESMRTYTDNGISYELSDFCISFGAYSWNDCFGLTVQELSMEENTAYAIYDDLGLYKYDHPGITVALSQNPVGQTGLTNVASVGAFVVRSVKNDFIRTTMPLGAGQEIEIAFNDNVDPDKLSKGAAVLIDQDGNEEYLEPEYLGFDKIKVILPELKKKNIYTLRLTDSIISKGGRSLSVTDIPIDSAGEAEITYIKTSDEGDGITVMATVENNIVSKKNAAAIAGVYKDGILSGDVKYQQFTLEPGKPYFLTFDGFQAEKDEEIKIFILESPIAGVALADSIIIAP